MYSMHQNEIFRLWRRYPYPTPDKRACRSSGRVCEVDSTSKAHRAISCRDIEVVITGERSKKDIICHFCKRVTKIRRIEAEFTRRTIRLYFRKGKDSKSDWFRYQAFFHKNLIKYAEISKWS